MGRCVIHYPPKPQDMVEAARTSVKDADASGMADISKAIQQAQSPNELAPLEDDDRSRRRLREERRNGY